MEGARVCAHVITHIRTHSNTHTHTHTQRERERERERENYVHVDIHVAREQALSLFARVRCSPGPDLRISTRGWMEPYVFV
jgi:hypothetical protein